MGWMTPRLSVARAARVMLPVAPGRQSNAKRCHDHCRRSSSLAGSQLPPPSTLTSTWATPAAAQAHPQISTGAAAGRAGAGATMRASGGAAYTGRVPPVDGSGSL
jgi:hypothetical protein